ncbi:MAG TPA: glycosyl transferase [Candidatus Goldiibacteriota bacterium]|jgi:cellobiose phosphorylase|nr:glycosyl transferase [Candidatus Goldiibacteriota bacterium]
MKYGFFDDKNREYVITRPDTPLPWINYLGVDKYCGLMSNTAGGYSFYGDAAQRRILRYRYNNVPSDRPGRYIYIRDNDKEDYWSASWQPTNKDLKKYKYECRHGLSYTKIKAEYSQIQSEATYFVPVGAAHEIWRIKLKNNSSKPRKMSLFTYVEFCLWDAMNDMTDFQYNLNIGRTEFKNNAMYHTTLYNMHKHQFAYFWADKKVASYDGVRQDFTGPYRGEANPIAVERGKCSNTLAVGWAPFGGLHINVNLKAKEEKEVTFVLGYCDDMGKEEKVFEKYSKKGAVDQELKTLAGYWENNLQKYQCETPDPTVNSMVNVWNQYQCMTTFNWSRSASYYEAGGERGMGFRDSNQDTLGFVHMIPNKVHDRLVDIASVQFPEGRAHHGYSPLTKKGSREGYGDDHLWLVQAVHNYIKETGDIRFLDEIVPYNDGSKGKMYEHIQKAVEYSWNNTGYHGLPKAGFADWNDCLNLSGPKGMGVSVMIACQFVLGANLLSELAQRSGRVLDVEKYKNMADEMKDRINKKAWDGEWYLRAFDDNGTPVGTNESKEAKIWLESNTWAVMTGVAEGDRAEITLDSIKKHLDTKYGIVLFDPAFSEYHPELGYVSVFPGGLKENAAIFCHTNPWAMVAEAMTGRAANAFKYWKTIAPAANNEIADKHWTEPYVYSQMIAGKAHKDFGQAKNSWLTGTAAWNFVAISQYILGIRATFDGLMIDPCIPSSWKGFTVSREFRGTKYNFTVKNPSKASKGIKKMSVDGKEIKGNIVPIEKNKKEVNIEVVM